MKDVLQDPNDPAAISHVLCSDGLYHGSSMLTFELPHHTKLLSACGGVLVESQGLIYHGMESVYGKGMIVMKKGDGLVLVSELVWSIQVFRSKNLERLPGVYFRADDYGTWHCTKHPDDCDRGDDPGSS